MRFRMNISKLKNAVVQYSLTSQGAWLQEIDWQRIRIMEANCRISAGMRWEVPPVILLSDQGREDLNFGILVHEIYHAWQRETQGLLKYSLNNLFKRNEPAAYEETNRAIEFYGKL